MSNFENTFESIIDEVHSVRKKYSSLRFINDNDRLVLKGDLQFQANFNNERIDDCYTVVIEFPQEYPAEFPVVRELGDRIPSGYHTNPDGTLCLGVYSIVCMKFNANPTVLTFIEDLLIPYLYRHSYIEKYDREPWGERSHGDEGVYEFYSDYLDTKDIRMIVALVGLIVTKKYKGHKPCPCSSGLILRKCHGPKLLNLLTIPLKYLAIDATALLRCMKKG